MTVYYDKARKRWRYDFQRGNRRFSNYCLDSEQRPVRSRRAAELAERLAIAGAERKIRVPVSTVPGVYSLARAIDAYGDRAERNRSWPRAMEHLAEIGARLGPLIPVEELTDERVAAFMREAAAAPRRVWRGGPRRPKDDTARGWRDGPPRAAGTINRLLATLSAVLRLAHATRNPETGRPLLEHMPKIEKVRTSRRLPRPVGLDHLGMIRAAAAPHLQDAIDLTVCFGLRLQETLGLGPDSVDAAHGGIWLDGDETKGRADAFIPGDAAAMALALRLADRARKAGLDRLVLYARPYKDPKSGELRHRLEPIRSLKTAWHAACRRAGVPPARFHDLKATFVTQAMAGGAPPASVQDLARHRSYETTRLYMQVADPIRRAAVDGLGARVLAESPTRQSHTGLAANRPKGAKSLK